MTKRMFTLAEITKAARYWYGLADMNNCCLAENRLMRGELPYEGF